MIRKRCHEVQKGSIIFTIIVGLLYVLPARADSLNMTLEGSLRYWSTAYRITVDGNYGYVTTRSSGLHILDLTNLPEIEEIAAVPAPGLPNSEARDFDISGDTGYLVGEDGCGLTIIDLSDPHQPQIMANISQLNASDVAVNENCVYVSDGLGNEGLKIYDVSNPADPVQISSLDLQVDNVEIDSDIAFMAAGTNGLHIYDVSDPSNPQELSIYNCTALEVTIFDHYACIAADWDGIEIINIEDPTNPQHVSSFEEGLGENFITHVFHNDGYIYSAVNGIAHKTWIVDVSNAASPQLISEIQASPDFSNNSVYGSRIYGNFLLSPVAYSGLQIVEISNPASPVEVSIYDDRMLALNDVIGFGDVTYLGASTGLLIMDTGDLSLPQELMRIETNGGVFDLLLDQNILYAATSNTGTVIYDVSSLTDPTEIETIPSAGSASRRLALNDGFLAIADEDFGLKFFDVSDPSSPVELGGLTGPYSVSDIGVLDGYVVLLEYRAMAGNILSVIDVQNPADAAIIWSQTSDSWGRMNLSGNTAYLSMGWDGIDVYSFDNPEEPEFITDFQPNGSTSYSVKHENMLYTTFTTFSTNGIRIFDITDIQNPLIAGYHTSVGFRPYICMVYDNIVYCVGTREFHILTADPQSGINDSNEPFTKISDYRLHPASPNPFNPVTFLQVSMPNAGELTVAVYDVMGQKVLELAHDSYSAGTYNLRFDGSGLASGIYFIRATVPNKLNEIQKAILLK